MRFVLGVAIGLGVGFAAAVLLAPEKKKEQSTEWPSRVLNEATGTNGHQESGMKGLVATVRERLDEAMAEAGEARRQAEREMNERYQRSIGKRKDA
jgi:gas vesicle protein